MGGGGGSVLGLSSSRLLGIEKSVWEEVRHLLPELPGTCQVIVSNSVFLGLQLEWSAWQVQLGKGPKPYLNPKEPTFFRDVYEDFITRNPQKVGCLRLR